MPDAIVFIGPSLKLEEAYKILPREFEVDSHCDENPKKTVHVEYLPPIKRGDIDAVIAKNPRIICIIDGLFFQNCSVGHREILKAINSGIEVYGASSMGALRACELEDFGMWGVGKVFEMYNTGVIESDDEVALACDPDTNEAISDALVDIRLNIERCLVMGQIMPQEAEGIINAAISCYYPRRTFRNALEEARSKDLISDDTYEKLKDYRESRKWFSQKERDARDILGLVAEKLTNFV